MHHNTDNHCGKRAAGFVFTDGKSILLLKRTKKDKNFQKWACPGGKVKGEETFLGAAQRETEEEIGHLPKGHRIGSLDSQGHTHLFRAFVCKVPQRFQCKLNDEHDDWNWFPLANIDRVDLLDSLKKSMPDILRIIRTLDDKKDEMSGFAGYLSVCEVGAATGDLYAGYRSGPDYQVEGDPSSMIRPKRRKKKK